MMGSSRAPGVFTSFALPVPGHPMSSWLRSPKSCRRHSEGRPAPATKIRGPLRGPSDARPANTQLSAPLMGSFRANASSRIRGRIGFVSRRAFSRVGASLGSSCVSGSGGMAGIGFVSQGRSTGVAWLRFAERLGALGSSCAGRRRKFRERIGFVPRGAIMVPAPSRDDRSNQRACHPYGDLCWVRFDWRPQRVEFGPPGANRGQHALTDMGDCHRKLVPCRGLKECRANRGPKPGRGTIEWGRRFEADFSENPAVFGPIAPRKSTSLRFASRRGAWRGILRSAVEEAWAGVLPRCHRRPGVPP